MSSLPGFSLAAQLRAGETVHTGWCGLPAPMVAEVVAREGFSAVTLDSQHGMWDLAGLAAGIAAVRQAGAAPIVRVPLGDFAMVSRVLDFGAEGIIAPMINTAADARAFAAAAKFPPIGERSWGPHRATMLAGIADQKDYLANGQRQHRHAGDDRDPHRARQYRRDRGDAGHRRPVPRAVRSLDRAVRRPHARSGVEGGRGRARPHRRGGAEGRQDSPAPIARSAERALAVAKRGMRFCAISSDMAFLRAGARVAARQAEVNPARYFSVIWYDIEPTT